jgi:hypothetical protein
MNFPIPSHLISKVSAFCLLTATVFLANGSAAIAASSNIQDFIPKGYRLEKSLSTDLNGDQQNDQILQVIESGDRYGRKRSLIVLLGSKSGWQPLAVAPNLLFASGMGGMIENIRIEVQAKNVLVVKQLAGSRGAISVIHRFWIDRSSQRLVLIGEDVNPYDRANGNEIRDSRNFLTGKRIVEEYRGRKSRDGKDLVKRQQLEVSRKLQEIETIDIEAVRSNAPVLPD